MEKVVAADFRPGDVVGARRWPMESAHPDAWETPWRGEVLDPSSPEAWEGTLAFPGGPPSQTELDAHLARLSANEEWPKNLVPVRWAFGKVLWERATALRSYDEDVAEWRRERQKAYQAAGRPSAD